MTARRRGYLGRAVAWTPARRVAPRGSACRARATARSAQPPVRALHRAPRSRAARPTGRRAAGGRRRRSRRRRPGRVPLQSASWPSSQGAGETPRSRALPNPGCGASQCQTPPCTSRMERCYARTRATRFTKRARPARNPRFAHWTIASASGWASLSRSLSCACLTRGSSMPKSPTRQSLNWRITSKSACRCRPFASPDRKYSSEATEVTGRRPLHVDSHQSPG
jgi:hypothetical protein